MICLDITFLSQFHLVAIIIFGAVTVAIYHSIVIAITSVSFSIGMAIATNSATTCLNSTTAVTIFLEIEKISILPLAENLQFEYLALR